MPSETVIVSYIEHIASTSAAIAVIYTAWAGSRQIKTWTKDKLFDRRTKHAIKIINMLHRAREVIRESRNPFMMGKDIKQAKLRLKHHIKIRNKRKEEPEAKESLILLKVSALYCRLELEEHIFRKISNYTPTAKFIFDSDIQLLLNDLVRVYRHLMRDALIILNSSDEERSEDKIKSLFIKPFGKKDDKISKKIDSIIDRVEIRIQEIMGTK